MLKWGLGSTLRDAGSIGPVAQSRALKTEGLMFRPYGAGDHQVHTGNDQGDYGVLGMEPGLALLYFLSCF